jgi:hypothetical protein
MRCATSLWVALMIAPPTDLQRPGADVRGAGRQSQEHPAGQGLAIDLGLIQKLGAKR